MHVSIRTAVVALLIGALSPVLGGVASAEEAADSWIALPLTGIWDTAVDETHGKLFISSGRTGQITVVGSSGAPAHEIVGTEGATDLSLNADGSRLYAAAPGSDAVLAIDTTSEIVQVLDTGDQTCPQSVAAVGAVVWYAADDGCYGSHSLLRVLDPTTGTTSSALGSYPRGLYHYPQLVPVPGGRYLVAADTGVSGGSLDVIDVITRTLVTHTFPTFGPGEIVASDDGSEIVEGNSPVTVRSIPALATTGTFAADSGLITADQGFVAARGGLSAEVSVFERSTHDLLNTVRFGALERSEGLAPSRIALLDGVLLGVVDTGSGGFRLYRAPQPGVTAPELTVTSPTVTIGKPAILSGTLRLDGSPLPGVELRIIEDNGTVVGRSVTDSNGQWTWANTWRTAGWVQLGFVAEGSAEYKSSTAHVAFEVHKLTSSLELTAPAPPAPSDPFSVQGVLKVDGQAAHPESVSWSWACLEPYASGADGSSPTSSSGGFTAQVVPGPPCPTYRLWAWWDGDAVTQGASASIDVSPTWKPSHLELSVAGNGFVGDVPTAKVTLSIDGTPATNRAVDVTIKRPDLSVTTVSGETGPDGIANVPVSLPTAGTYTITARFSGDAATLGSKAVATSTVTTASSVLTFEADEETTMIGDPVHLSGTLVRQDGINGDVPVHIIAVDQDGARRDQQVTTAADGSFTATDVPQTGERTTYWALYEGDPPRYLAADQVQLGVAVTKLPSGLVLRTDRDSYVGGQTAHVFVDTAVPGAQVTLKVAETGRPARTIFSGAVPASGRIVDITLLHSSVFTVITPATATHAGQTRTVLASARLGLRTRLLGGIARGAWRLYPASADPAMVTIVTPDRAVCLRFQVQRRVATGWRTVSTSTCRRVIDRRARFVLTGRQRPAVGYRIRPMFSGDAWNASTTGAWTYLRFR